MSAKNWTDCPQCGLNEERRQEAAKKKADESYGNVPMDEYMELLRNIEPRELGETLREDYELYHVGGAFHVHYECSCDCCGFSHKFRHSEASYS